MGKALYIIYDDRVKPEAEIREIIGESSFGSVCIRKKTLYGLFRESMEKIFPDRERIITISPGEAMQPLTEFLPEGRDVCALHWFSDCLIADVGAAALTLEKVRYVKGTVCLMVGEHLAGLLFGDRESCVKFWRSAKREKDEVLTAYGERRLGIEEGGLYIGALDGFVSCLTGDFDSRYFNSLSGDEYTVVKSSTDKEKMRKEYMYYQLLPEDMRRWFVMPYAYEEKADIASYSMERLHMPNVAVKWIHQSVDMQEFAELLDKYFRFFSVRHRKLVSPEAAIKVNNSLFLEKVESRLRDLKKHEAYKKMEALLANSPRLLSIDEIFSRYRNLKAIMQQTASRPELVIGHGDPCFSNTLYSRTTQMLKFIDPKGALSEDDLYTDPYYDIAKLSHSICGNYDYINNGIFDIFLDESLEYVLDIPFDNQRYKMVFKAKLEEAGMDYYLVRLYEASLFLSMLPLHIDNPQRVFAFILNAVGILEEIEEHVHRL